jgi:rSAM/selenodomain-associated transferase 1
LADRRFLVYAPAGAREYFASLAADDYTLENQAEGELGQRLAQFMKRHLEGGNRVVVLGSDSPTVPAEYVVRAFDELERADVVLGPATDGGYYLIGCRARCPPLFENMPWGGREVLQETVTRIRAAGLRLGLLPPWYDIDTLADVQMLRGHLAALRLAGVDPGAGRTEAASENYESRTSKSASDFTKSEVRT